MLTNDKNGDRLTLRTVMDEPCLLYEDARRIVSRAAGTGAELEAVRTAMRRLDDLMEGYWCGVGELESCKDIVDVVRPFIPLAERPAEPASGTGAQAKVEAMFESGSLFKEIEKAESITVPTQTNRGEARIFWGSCESGIHHPRLESRRNPDFLILELDELKDRMIVEHGIDEKRQDVDMIFYAYMQLALDKIIREHKNVTLCVDKNFDRCFDWAAFLKRNGYRVKTPCITLSLPHQLLRSAGKRLAASAWGLPELDRPSLADNIESFGRVDKLLKKTESDKAHPLGNRFYMKRGYNEFTYHPNSKISVCEGWRKVTTLEDEERNEIVRHTGILAQQAADMYRQGFLTEERFSEIADMLRYIDEHEVRLPKDALEQLDETKCPVIPGSRREVAIYENRFAERKLEFDAEPLVVEKEMCFDEIQSGVFLEPEEQYVLQMEADDAFQYYYRGGSKKNAFDRINDVLQRFRNLNEEARRAFELNDGSNEFMEPIQ